jgi:hypothetical protein
LARLQNGAAGAVSGYLAFGSSMDYFYQELKTPYPITVEVYGSRHAGKLNSYTNPFLPVAHSGGRRLEQTPRVHREPGVWGPTELNCFKLFNPETQTAYRQVRVGLLSAPPGCSPAFASGFSEGWLPTGLWRVSPRERTWPCRGAGGAAQASEQAQLQAKASERRVSRRRRRH